MADDASAGKGIVEPVDQATAKKITPVDAGEIVEIHRHLVTRQRADHGLGNTVGVVALGLIPAQGLAMGELHMDRRLDTKAFNTVPHNRLLIKLSRLGVDEATIGWIGLFLRGRRQRVLLEGATSEEVPVLSGVPQGSVIGPILFLAYINDLPQDLTSEVRLFADDTVLSREVRNDQDAKDLQTDLRKLERWSQTWQMNFHPRKCQVLHVSKSREIRKWQYTLYDTPLEEVDSIKYLGIHISHDLRWNKQVESTRAKANQKLGFLRRNIRVASPHLKTQLYNTIVRSTLEYAATVWSPYESKHTERLEGVQRRAARWVLNRHRRTESVTAMLVHLAWLTLAQRRTYNRLVMLYKIRSNMFPTLFLSTVATRHIHNLTYTPFQPRTNYFKFSFFPNVVSHWNSLPSTVLDSSNVEMFQARLLQQQVATTLTI